MHTIPIDDPTDPRLDPYRDLKHEDVRNRGPLFIAEGKLVVQRLLKSRYQTHSVLAEARRLTELAPYIDAHTPVFVVSQDLISEVAGFNFHRGLLACGRRIPFGSISEFDSLARPGELALAAITLNDLENLGSLIRTAAALGVFNVVLNRQTADPLCRRVLRVSMGAVLKMRFFDLADASAWFETTREANRWQTIAMTLAPDSVSLQACVQDAAPKVLVMGSEGEGLPLAIQNACHLRAKIPMAPGIDSLNVSVAGAIALYEFTRRQRLQESDD